MTINPDTANDAIDQAYDELYAHSNSFALLSLASRLMVIERVVPINPPEVSKVIASLNRAVCEIEHNIRLATIGCDDATGE